MTNSIDWKYQNDVVTWSHACNFKNSNGLIASKVSGEKCGWECLKKSGCTHFEWTDFQNGTCWMKQGKVNELNATSNNNFNMVCGFLHYYSNILISILIYDFILFLIDFFDLIRYFKMEFE